MAHKQQFKSFDDMVRGSRTPILVDFYASWCGPCRLMAEVLEQVKPQVGDAVSFVKVDTEKYPNIAARWGIQALPTLILFKDGQPIDRIEGLLQPPALLERLRAQVNLPVA
ncbi:MAG: thioredoxin [Thermostichus sp. DG_1_6_bins_120]